MASRPSAGGGGGAGTAVSGSGSDQRDYSQERKHTSSGSGSQGLHSPHRHHYRAASASRHIKETRNARSEHVNSEDDGASQRRINQYLIQQEIGRGSFGAVHLATDQFGKEYAVKEFSKARLRRRAKSHLLRQKHQEKISIGPGPGRNLRKPDQFSEAEDNAFDLIKEEIAIMKKLDHGNLVSLIEVLDDPEEDSLFMVLEMCKKGVVMRLDIEDTAEPYDEENCRVWFRDLILGIEYLHAQGVVHRDIKPDNCLLTEDDTLKLVDFGVSEMFEKTSDMKIAKSAGSPAFMAPELCVPQQGGVFGKPADIWSMGVTLYCLKFGHVPFRKTNMLEMYDSIVHDQVSIPADCSPELKDLLIRILEKDPEKRIRMGDLRAHPWVTKNGEDPLLASDINCAVFITAPTEEEKNAAITDNMGGLIAVVKAANKFKQLLGRRHPEFVEGILGRASRFVAPPEAIEDHRSKFGFRNAIRSKMTRHGFGAEELNITLPSSGIYREKDVRSEEGKMIAQLKGMDIEPGRFPRARQTEPAPSTSPQDVPQKRLSYDETAKGHAHDVLKDHVFIDIGPGPCDLDDTGHDHQHAFVVSESPPATDIPLYERAFEDEVESIGQSGRDSRIYLTRRIEKGLARGSRIATAFGKAVHGHQIPEAEDEAAVDDDTRAGQRMGHKVGSAWGKIVDVAHAHRKSSDEPDTAQSPPAKAPPTEARSALQGSGLAAAVSAAVKAADKTAPSASKD